MVIDSIPRVTPIVESVDNFVNNRRMAQIFEAKVGKGRLIMCSMDLLTDGELPEIRQLRYSLTNYMLTKDFQQTVTLSEADLRSLLLEKAVEQKTGAISIYD